MIILFHLFILFVVALPTDSEGNFISQHAHPPSPDTPDPTKTSSWHPFVSRLSFDWAYHHFAEVQSSEKEIEKGLDLWLAAKLEAGDETPLPWASAREMYATIDAIQEGEAPFQTISIKYAGHRPPNPPRWMMQTYQLCTRNSCLLLQHQLANGDFKSQFDYKPYRQINHRNDRVWSNLMSADWAWAEAVSNVQYMIIYPIG